MAEKPPETSRMLLSMVALDRPSLPPPEEMFETLAALAGTAERPKDIKANEGNLAFLLGGNAAAMALMPSPILWSNLEGPCETAWWWPEAGEKMRGHNSHLLVALGAESGDAVRRSLALTYLTAAVAAHVDAAGIYWGGGGSFTIRGSSWKKPAAPCRRICPCTFGSTSASNPTTMARCVCSRPE